MMRPSVTGSRTASARLLGGMAILLCSASLSAVSCGGVEPASDPAEPSSVQAYAIDGRVVLAGAGGEVRSLELPVRAERVFGVTDAGVLVGAEPRRVIPNSDEVGGENLWLVGRDGGGARRLTTGQDVLRAVHSPALEGIVVWTADMRILLVQPGGGAPRQLAARAASPAVSPDGARVAYARLPDAWEEGDNPGGFDLHVLDLATGEDRALTTGYDDAEPIWSPDGRRLLFLSGGRTGLTSLWRIDADGTDLAQVTNIGRDAVDASFVPNPSAGSEVRWAEDGGALIYGTDYAAEGEVMLLRLSGELDLVEARSLGEGHAPVWIDRRTVRVARQEGGVVRFVAVDEHGRRGGAAAEVPGTLRTRAVLADEAWNQRVIDVGEGEAPVPMSGTAPHRFRLPLAVNPGYSAYYDNSCGAGVMDWKCGIATYNGHKGTDLVAAAGTSVYAGDGGNVVARNDGCATVGYLGNTCGGGFGNYVKIDHGSSWYSVYAHFTHGTAIGFVPVGCGQYLGKSGSSGNSSGYHLHFEVQRYGACGDDPFAGTCSDPVSLWTNQNGGYPTLACH